MADELARLAVEVEGATGPDRHLDREIGIAVLGWTTWPDDQDQGHGWLKDHEGNTYPDSPGADYPSLTDSLDAVVALIHQLLPGCGHAHMQGPGYRFATGSIIRPPVDADASITNGDSWSVHIDGRGATPALALLSATLRALASQEKADADA